MELIVVNTPIKLPTLLAACGLAWICVGLGANAQGTNAPGPNLCGELTNGYGPYDYRKERHGALRIVESHHFTREVEQLQRGKEGYLAGDIDYTLRASPNHHRALIALSKLSMREKTEKLPHTNYTVDCYFDRAMRFQPDDQVARMLYVQHLLQTNRKADALQNLQVAGSMAADNAITHRNVGLLYLEAKELDKALEHASRARDLGYPRTDLLDKLRAAGKEVPAPQPAEAKTN